MIIPWLLLAVVILVAAGRHFLKSPKDEREPIVLSSKIPYIGHLLALFRYQGAYFKSLSAFHPSLGIFTLEIFSTKIYVISSPELAQSLLCNTRSLSFYQFHIAFTNRALGARQEVKDTVAEHEGHNVYMGEIHNAMYGALSLGPSILETNRSVANSLARFLNAIGTVEQSLLFFDWMKTAFTLTTAESFYGPDNPLADNHDFVKSVWDFEEQLPLLFLGIFPRITARKAWQARKAMAPAFIEYYNKGLDRNANDFIQGRARAGRAANFTNTDLATFEITVLFASLTNTVPNTFAMLCHILRDPALTYAIRDEVSNFATKTVDKDGITHIDLDISSFNTKCPLLTATFKETIRICVNATPVRVVTEDMILKNTYLLKKGGIIQVAGGAIHESRAIWGDDFAVFNPYRFLKSDSDTMTKEQKRMQDKGLLPFGGGKHLCPGRHLAFVEVVSFVALLVLGWEVRMGDREGGGRVQMPAWRKQPLGENSKKPGRDIKVLVRRREEYRDVVFGFTVDVEADVGKLSPF